MLENTFANLMFIFNLGTNLENTKIIKFRYPISIRSMSKNTFLNSELRSETSILLIELHIDLTFLKNTDKSHISVVEFQQNISIFENCQIDMVLVEEDRGLGSQFWAQKRVLWSWTNRYRISNFYNFFIFWVRSRFEYEFPLSEGISFSYWIWGPVGLCYQHSLMSS